MEWFILESLLALAIALGIVWWTIRPAKRRKDGDGNDPGR
jgi:hypothetical protein